MRDKHPRWEDTHEYIPDDFDSLAVQRFWDAWDDIAVQGDVLLKAKIVDWKAVKDTLLESN